jgi:hypothetical protein
MRAWVLLPLAADLDLATDQLRASVEHQGAEALANVEH